MAVHRVEGPSSSCVQQASRRIFARYSPTRKRAHLLAWVRTHLLGTCSPADRRICVSSLAGRAGDARRPVFLLLACCTQEDDAARGVELTVRQGVHRVNDDCLYPASASVAQYVINDGNDVRQAFARAGASCEDVIPASPRPANRIGLVLI